MKRLFFLITIVAFLATIEAHSQNGWQTGRYYAYKGEVWTTCGYPYPKYNYDGWGNRYYIGTYKTCKTTVWHKEWRAGYVYYWDAFLGKWYYQWEEGYFWYYTWNVYEVFCY